MLTQRGRPSLLRGLFLGAALLSFAASADDRPTVIRVVLDDTYPPFSFRDHRGKSQGILIDQWRIWEQTTGIKAEIVPMDWGKALAAMRSNEFDVIDTAFETGERKDWLDFSRPYAKIETFIYFEESLSGITNAASLKGFRVGVKAGDAAVALLEQAGVEDLAAFDSYEEIVRAAKGQSLAVFVMDGPPADYFLYKLGIRDRFRQSAPLTSGEFHRAVRKGNAALLRVVEEGFSLLPQNALKRIDTRWHGAKPAPTASLRTVISVSCGLLLVSFLMIAWNRALHKRVALQTAELKASMEALQRNNELFSLFIQRSPVYSFIKDLTEEGDRVLYASENFAELLGIPASKMAGKTMFELFPVEFASKITADDWDVVNKGEVLKIDEDFGGRSYATIKFPILLGERKLLAGYTIDITERKQTEAAVRENEAFRRRVFDTSRVPIIVMAADTFQYIDCNPAAVDIYRFRSREETLGKSPLDVSAPEQYDGTPSETKARHYLERALAEGMVVFEWRHQRPDGEIWDAEVHLMSFQSAGRSLLQFTLSDITAKKRAEAQLRAYVRDIERISQISVGREQRVLELKQQVDTLSQALGLPQPYADTHQLITAEPPGTPVSLLEGGTPPEDEVPREYAIDDILDIENIQSLLDSFCDAVGNAAAIIDLDGRVLVGARWQRLCTGFHRVNPGTCARCIESDTRLATQLREGKRFSIYRCHNGLTDAASPIIIEGRHMANVFVGQFLLAPPDEAFFRKQCQEFGFEEQEYFEALAQVPVIPETKLPAILEFLTSCARMLMKTGLERIRGLDSEKRLASQAETLRNVIAELRVQRQAALSLAEDATEGRVAAEQARESLRESEERLKDIIFSMGDWVWEIDASGVYTYSSEKGFEYFGPNPDDVLGKKPFDFMPQEEAQRVAAVFSNLVARKEPFRDFENWNRTKTGEPICLLSSGVPVFDAEGNLKGYRGVDRDITAHKRAEEVNARLEAQLQQAQKLESIGRLAGGVAHDFNNMLGVILGHAEIGLDSVDPEDPLHADLEEIFTAAQRSAALTRQLLAFARKQTVAPKVLDLNGTVSGMLRMLERLIGEDIALTWRPGDNLWPVKVDPSQVDQMLANLCVNARDAIAGVGKITIETGQDVFDEAYCGAHPGYVPGAYVWFSVTDTGHGIAPEQLEHIFEPFFTTKGLGQGTGLGLAMVYGAVTQNRGFIQARSEPGQGACFTVYLPRHLGNIQETRREVPVIGVPLTSITVLVVEDEPSIMRLARALLVRHGYTVLSSDTPGAALRLAREHHGNIDLLVTDVVMPEMNGRDLAQNLATMYPEIRCLYMSGYTADVIAQQGILEEDVNFLPKPFSREQLLSKVREVLDATGSDPGL